MKRILVIEDEQNLANLIEETLVAEKFKVDKAYDGDLGMEYFYKRKPDLVLLDINLPTRSGWSVCKEIRAKSSIPIVMMTARDSEIDQLQGLELGAEDYITKPFSLKVLMVKIKKILKLSTTTLYKYEGFEFNTENYDLRIDNVSLELTKKQAQILDFFIRNKGVIFTREQLLDEVWGYDYFGDDRVVDTLIKRLRERMGDYSYLIKTLRGLGYSFDEKR